MKTWFFTENAYPNLPDADSYESIRVNLPNSNFDPELGAGLFNMYLDIWGAADEMGLEIMLNEHHQTATCVLSAAPIALGILARETKKARLLILGNPIVNRKQPIRVAEEMAYIDVLSRGRVDCGFVRGVPYEIAPANAYPYRGSEKLWEAHDLIMKAWTTHDGPFNFEGRWFTGRQVNIWPRPYQQPHPPVWVTMGSAGSAAQVAQRKHIGAVFLAGYANIRRLFDGYREGYLQAHGEEAPLDRLAYAAIVHVADSNEEAEKGSEKLLWYIRSNKVASQFNNPPGYHPPAVAANLIRGPRPGEPDRRDPRFETQLSRGNIFSGTPDQVFQQIKSFWEYSGGFGHLLMMGQAGFMTYEETMKSMKLFTEEVAPRLNELTASYEAGAMKELRKSLPDVDTVDVGLLASEFVR